VIKNIDSRLKFELDGAESFVSNLFWDLESWITSIKDETGSVKSLEDKQKLDKFLRRGFMMRLSKFSSMIRHAYKRLLSDYKPSKHEEWIEVNLNRTIKEITEYHRPYFEAMGSALLLSDSSEITTWAEGENSGSPFTYVIWWLLDAWPNSQIAVNLIADEDSARIIFEAPGIHRQREYDEDHKNLSVWSRVIEYLIVVERHGRCFWPQTGEVCRLEIVLPKRPPTDKELEEPLPMWMQSSGLDEDEQA
jgi:hypothetical protein